MAHFLNCKCCGQYRARYKSRPKRIELPGMPLYYLKSCEGVNVIVEFKDFTLVFIKISCGEAFENNIWVNPVSAVSGLILQSLTDLFHPKIFVPKLNGFGLFLYAARVHLKYTV